MKDQVKIAVIIGGAIVLATCIYIYFSPYQSCVRAARDSNTDSEWSDEYIRMRCAEIASG